ncbi:MAG: small basic protein [Phycisphaerales bacterium]
MSIDRSLKTEGSLTTKRSVMKRHERLEALKEEKRHPGGDKGALGLPKTKVRDS